MWLKLAVAVAIVLAAAAQERPSFRAESVVPFGGRRGGPFAPGIAVNLYGLNLARGICRETGQAVEMACQTVVLADDKPAKLLYVSTNQISLRLPDDLPKDGMVPLRVVSQGVSSLPVLIRLSSRPVIAMAEPAYTGLPVWLAVELPYPLTGILAYPVSFDPSDFGDSAIEIRKEGKLMPEAPLGAPPGIVRPKPARPGSSLGIAAAAAALRDRLPVPLRYRFEEPGVYRARYFLIYQEVAYGIRTERTLRSEWTEFTILPSTPELREAWLEGMKRQAPEDAGELLCSFLPSLLAQRTPESFEILSRYFNHRSGFVQVYTRNVAPLFAGIVPQDRMPGPIGRIAF